MKFGGPLCGDPGQRDEARHAELPFGTGTAVITPPCRRWPHTALSAQRESALQILLSMFTSESAGGIAWPGELWRRAGSSRRKFRLDQLLYVPCSQRAKAPCSTSQCGPIRLPGNSPLEIDALTSSASTRNTEAASSAVRTRSSGTGEPGAMGVPAASPGSGSGFFPSVADDAAGSGRSAVSAGSAGDRVLACAVSSAAASTS